jgi:hypothetical protein
MERRDALTQTQLYYQGHEINDMSLGPHQFKPRLGEARELLHSDFGIDPDLPRLKLPKQKWEKHYSRRRLYAEMPWRKLYTNGAPNMGWINDGKEKIGHAGGRGGGGGGGDEHGEDDLEEDDWEQEQDSEEHDFEEDESEEFDLDG